MKQSKREAGKVATPDSVEQLEILRYIARMSQELTDMAHQVDCKFLAYLLNMASMAAREEAARIADEGKAEECPC
jgi:hypothetical protein